jgi:hypothetical protein
MSSKVQQVLDARAKEICAQLGSLKLQQEHLDSVQKQLEDKFDEVANAQRDIKKAEDSINAELQALNSIAPSLMALEAAVNNQEHPNSEDEKSSEAANQEQSSSEDADQNPSSSEDADQNPSSSEVAKQNPSNSEDEDSSEASNQEPLDE